MRALGKFFSNWWVVSLLVLLLVVVVLAVLAPLLIGPLRPLWVRLTITLVAVAIWGALALWRVLAARRASDQIARGLAEPTAGHAEAQRLTERMQQALDALKSTSARRRDYLYSRPWYVIIGPSGAGKTTALVNSGLRFPFSDTAFQGVGGTRDVDFLFADEAVLVDTAGRYTSHDSDAERDRDGWRAFLRLLKRHRPLQPINGIMISLGLDELAGGDLARIDAHATRVRRRLAELEQELEIAVPAYVVFTKLDLLAGFTEFYGELPVDGRRSVLGATLPWSGDNRSDATVMASAFDGVSQAVADRLSSRLQEANDPRQRALIIGFPGQFAALRSRLVRFLDGVFPSTGYAGRTILRGFYMTSGVQQGTPIDRLLSSVAEVYDAPTQGQGSGRAYFINRLLTDVIIAEAGLVRSSPQAQARRAFALTAGVAAVAAVTILVLALWTVSTVANRGWQGRLLTAASGVSQKVNADGLNLAEVKDSDPDLQSSLDVLRDLRNLPGGYADLKKGVPLSRRFGLYQASDANAATEAYSQGLQRIMLPRIILRLERVLNDAQGDALGLYEPLKIYMMLGGWGPSLDKAAVKGWVVADWRDKLYPGEGNAALRKELTEHLDALLADPHFGEVWPEHRAPLDGGLIKASQTRVLTLSVGQRAYAILKQRADAAGQPDWRADGVLTTGDAKAFADPQGVLGQSVPYFFTKKGFDDAYQLGLVTVENELVKDAWVMGDNQSRSSLHQQLEQMRPVVGRLYADAYSQAWSGMVQSLKPADYFSDMGAAAAATSSSPPLKVLLLAVRQNTALGAPAAAPAAPSMPSIGIGGFRAPNVALPADQAAPAVDPGQLIAGNFKDLNNFVGDGKSPAPVDDFIAKLKTAVTDKDAATRAGGLPGASDAAQADLNKAMAELATSAAQAPSMIQGFTTQASHQGDAAQVSAAQGAISASYDQEVAPPCKSVTEDHYPFVTASNTDASVADMQRVFGPNGPVDSFVQQKLLAMIDSSGPVWRWRSDNTVSASFDPESAGEFQKAVQIRDLLLGGLPLKVQLVSFGGGATAAELRIGDTSGRFDAASPGQHQFQWTASSLQEAQLVLIVGSQRQQPIAFEGTPWALFRLMDAARKEPAGPQAMRATFDEGASEVTFKILLPSVNNPFSRGGAWSFRCPPKL